MTPLDSAIDSDGSAAPNLSNLARAIRIIRELASRPRRPTDLVKELGLSWATLHRTLSQLEKEGFVEREDSGRYRAGRQLWVLGSAYLVGLPLVEIGRTYVRQASEELPDVAFQLCVRSGDAVAVLDAVQQTGETITMATYGFSFPLHCGSKGLTLLAYLTPEQQERYLAQPLSRLTPSTIVDPDELRDMLGTVRKEGVCRTTGDVQTFTGSIAAPVRDRSSAVVASLTGITSTRFLTEGPFEERLREVVLRTASNISTGLGWDAMSQ